MFFRDKSNLDKLVLESVNPSVTFISNPIKAKSREEQVNHWMFTPNT